jgi:hypothetical protein
MVVSKTAYNRQSEDNMHVSKYRLDVPERKLKTISEAIVISILTPELKIS